MENIVSYIAGSVVAVVFSFAGIFGIHGPSSEAHSVPQVPLPAQTTNEIYQGSVDVLYATSSSASSSEALSIDTATQTEASAVLHPIEAEPTSSQSATNVTTLPLGDGKISSVPKVGYVYSCQQNFSGGGAQHVGDWIHGTTWDSTAKLHVEGEIYWNNASFTNMIAGALRIITGNGLPVSEPTGVFPIALTDPAYLIDRNPNAITAQDLSYQLPASPVFAVSPSCVPMGIIGVAQDGVAIFNALDASGRDAVAHEVQDLCDGHPEHSGEYHYHGPSVCMPHVNEKDTVVGFALDGFPITSLYNAEGKLYADADLDSCHGTTSTITIDGVQKTMYHYVLTKEYPYTIGCFMGTPIHTPLQDQNSTAPSSSVSGSTSTSTGQGSGNQPPKAAVDACAGKTSGSSCSITTPLGQKSGMCKNTPDGSFACVPN